MVFLMINQLIVSSNNVQVSQKRCTGTSIESFTSSSQSEQIIVFKLITDFEVKKKQRLRSDLEIAKSVSNKSPFFS